MAILPEQNRKKGRETEKRTAIIFFLQRASKATATTSRRPFFFSQCIIKFCSFVKRQQARRIAAGAREQGRDFWELETHSSKLAQGDANRGEPFFYLHSFYSIREDPKAGIFKSLILWLFSISNFHSAWRLQKKSHLKLRAKRATFTFENA